LLIRFAAVNGIVVATAAAAFDGGWRQRWLAVAGGGAAMALSAGGD
jgi:hypothetical protein